MLVPSPATDAFDQAEFDLAEEQRLASLELAAPHLDGYEVLRLIGEGTYGDVWEARETGTGVIVAIKRLRTQPDAQSCAEVEKLARLGSARGIVALREVHLATEPYCYVMEYLDGGTLADLVHRERKLPLAEAWRIFRQLNEALAYVHAEGIVHCDIKPENILLDARGNPRLGDFGQARGRGPGGAALGTRFYMPPEQARLEGLPDPRWDVYALGAVLYEMLTGNKPRYDTELASLMSSPTGSGSEVRDRLEKYARHLERSAPPQSHRKVKGIDATTARLIDDCLSVEFADRPQDASAVLKRIAQCEHARASKPLLIFGGLAPAIMLLLVAIVLYGVGFVTLSKLERQWDGLISAYYPHSGPALARAVASEVESLFTTQAEIVRREAGEPELYGLLVSSHGNTAKASRLTGRLQAIFKANEKDVYRWSLALADGTVVANFGRLVKDGREAIAVDEGTNGKNFAWRGWFNGVIDREESLAEPRDGDLADFRRRQPGQAYVAQPYSRKGDSQFLVIGVSCPIYGDRAAEPSGVISALMTYDQFFQKMQAKERDLARLGQQIVIVNEHYQVLYHSDRQRWLKASGGSFEVPRCPDCKHFVSALSTPLLADAMPGGPTRATAALAAPSGAASQGTAYTDPVTGEHCWGAAHVVQLGTGQRLAIFVQQQNPIRALWVRASWLAGGLTLLGALFLGINSYALYWTLRQQRAASGFGHALVAGYRHALSTAGTSEGSAHG